MNLVAIKKKWSIMEVLENRTLINMKSEPSSQLSVLERD